MVVLEIFFINLFGFFSPVSSRWKYLAKKYWSKKESNSREVTYAWKHASKVKTYKGFYIPTSKPKVELSEFFSQRREEDEKVFWDKFYGKKTNFKKTNFKKTNFKKTNFKKLLILKKLILKNFINFQLWGSIKKLKFTDTISLYTFLKLGKNYSIFLKKNTIFNFKYKTLSVMHPFINLDQPKIDLDWFILNRGFDSPQFFNFFFLMKLPIYLVSINFNFLKILFLKNIKTLYWKKFFIFKKNFFLRFSSSFSIFLLTSLSKYSNKIILDKFFFFLRIYKNWFIYYTNVNFFWNLIVYYLIDSKSIFLKKFIFFLLKKLLTRIVFFKDLLAGNLTDKKKKLLLNFLSILVGNNFFSISNRQLKKKKNFLIKYNLNISNSNFLLLNNNFLKELFFFKKNLFFNILSIDFDIYNLFSKIFTSFYMNLYINKQFNSSPLNFYFFQLSQNLNEKINFNYSKTNRFEKFSHFFLKSIQNYKNINMLLKNSFSQQLDLYTNINLINLLFWFLIRWGKKLTARWVLTNFIKEFKQKYKMPPLSVFTHAVLKLEPKIWLKKKKIAGWLYEIPIYISSWWSKTIAIWWLIGYAKKWKKYNISTSLAQEIWDTCFDWGSSINARILVHLTAKRNKSYMWWF